MLNKERDHRNYIVCWLIPYSYWWRHSWRWKEDNNNKEEKKSYCVQIPQVSTMVLTNDMYLNEENGILIS